MTSESGKGKLTGAQEAYRKRSAEEAARVAAVAAAAPASVTSTNSKSICPRPASSTDPTIPFEGLECPGCHVRYGIHWPGDVCWDCSARRRRKLDAQIQWRRESGLSAQHAKFKTWIDLNGPLPYLKAVNSVYDALALDEPTILGLIGPRGLGKTQVAELAVWQTIENGRSARIVTLLQLIADLKGRYGSDGNSEGDWLAEWSRPFLLAIDEITLQLGPDYSRLMLAMIVDARYRAKRQTILLGNATQEEFAAWVGDSVVSRCCETGGLILFDGWESFRVPKHDE